MAGQGLKRSLTTQRLT